MRVLLTAGSRTWEQSYVLEFIFVFFGQRHTNRTICRSTMCDTTHEMGCRPTISSNSQIVAGNQRCVPECEEQKIEEMLATAGSTRFIPDSGAGKQK